MPDLFARWRGLSDRLLNAMALTCGVLSLVGGIVLWRNAGPPFAWALFIAFGVTVIVFAGIRRPS
jgi:low affinity Fe/Cu permease